MHWTTPSIPELADLAPRARNAMWRRNAQKAAMHPYVRLVNRLTYVHFALLALALFFLPWLFGSNVYLFTLAMSMLVLSTVGSAWASHQVLVNHARAYLRIDRTNACPFCGTDRLCGKLDNCPDCGTSLSKAAQSAIPSTHSDDMAYLQRQFRWRFTLRGLLLAFFALCIPLTLMSSRLKSIRNQREIIADFESRGVNGICVTSWFGDVESIQPSGEFSNDDLGEICRLPHVSRLFLEGTQVDDNGLVSLMHLHHLEMLNLKDLDISDDGARHLQKLRKLRFLYLDGTRLTDAGLKYLGDISSLESVSLCRTNVTRDGIRRLMQELPDTTITH